MHPDGEGGTRDAGTRDPEDNLFAYPPRFADAGVGHDKASSGDVLPEHARPERFAELSLPPVEVLTGIAVDGLILAAMMLHVADHVARKSAGP